MSKHNFEPRIKSLPWGNNLITVVIPCFNEPDIITSLESLWKCERPGCGVEIIIVLNYPENADEQIVRFHLKTWEQLELWISLHVEEDFKYHAINAHSLPGKFAGVGLARKIGMDEAIYRYSLISNENGIICGFDADSTVDHNYFTAIENHFRNNSKSPGASIYFEHPLECIDDEKLKAGIIQYELHLRYLVRSIAFTMFPYAFHTVGSSFAVKASSYVKQGGMNKFKAGEDFYFLNKIMQLGGYTEINSTRVLPAARVSDRVPFGTGASMSRWMESYDNDLLTYQFESFLPLKKLFGNIEQIYQTKSLSKQLINSNTLWNFLQENNSDKAIDEILANSSTFSAFKKRFFNWFDAFKIVKYLNFAALTDYPKKPVTEQANKLLLCYNQISKDTVMELLDIYRSWDRQKGF